MDYFVPPAAVGMAALLGVLAPSTLAAPASGACSIMTKAEIKPFTSDPLFDRIAAKEEKEGRGSSCTYSGVYLQLDVIPFASIENMSRDKKEKIEAVKGVGDAAYARNNRDDYAELYVKVGQRTLTIQLDIGGQETFASVKPRLLKMGTAMAEKLR